MAANEAAVRPLSVLVVGVSWPMETFVERLVRGLANRGVEVTVRSRHRPPARWMAETGVRWEHGTGRPDRSSMRAAFEANGIAGALNAGVAGLRYRGDGPGRRGPVPDVVYAPWLNTLISYPGLFNLGVPVVTSARGSLVTIAPWDPGRPGHREHVAEVFQRCGAVHCVSDRIVDDAVQLGLDRSKATVIHPAVDPKMFDAGRPRRSGDAVRVIGVGTLNWVKDYEHALLALRHAVNAGADVRLDLIGDGPDRQHLEFAIDDLDLSDRVGLLGKRDPAEVAERLRDADVFLHTSSAEGISNAVLEAMSAGLPVVTTDAGGMSEAVRDGEDGFVVPVRDAAAAAKSLVRLASDPQLRERVGASARQRVLDRFRLDQQIDDFIELFRRVAAQ